MSQTRISAAGKTQLCAAFAAALLSSAVVAPAAESGVRKPAAQYLRAISDCRGRVLADDRKVAVTPFY